MTLTTLDYAAMFASTFFMVFLLGLQSKNVNQSRYFAAVVTSLGISIGNFTFIKYAAAGTLDAFVACAIGGCAGIAFSIWFSDNVLHKKRASGGFIFQKGPPALFGEKTEGYHQLNLKTRSALDSVRLAGIPKVGNNHVTANLTIDTVKQLHRTGIPMPGETK